MNNREIVKMAVKEAQKERPEIGSTCAHPSDPYTYELISYEGNTAILRWDGVEKRFPAEEIFDANVAMRIAKEIKAKQIEDFLSSYENN